MPSPYEPKDHIQRLDVAPRAEGIMDQREVTIQSYETAVPFDCEALDAGLEGAWLTPQIRFGVFSRSNLGDTEALNVVLALQDELSVRAYDYEKRRPLWFSWQNAIVDTVNIHYSRDEHGFLRFKAVGGGRRITDDRLHEFNSAFLGIPRDAVSKLHFDLAKLRELCFSRFADRLYMIRFSHPSGEEYRSIDHALFQSRKYIDPQAKRLQEVRADKQGTIESFDSDVDVRSDDLASPIQVRFFIRGLNGSLRLRFPKTQFKTQLKTPEEQARVFYRIVDIAADSILDADYYTQQRCSLEDLDTDVGMFPDLVDPGPFREVMASEEARKQFMSGIDIGAEWQEWKPHLRALDELIPSEIVAVHVAELVGEMVKRDPLMAARLLAVCQVDAKIYRVGAVVAGVAAAELQTIPPETRAQVEETLLSWALEREQDSWDVDSATGEIRVLKLRWRLDDLSLDVIPAVIWKLVGVLHERLKATTDDTDPLLRKLNWCMEAAKALSPNQPKSPAALRFIAAGRVPHSVADGDKVLREPVADLRALDEAVLNQYGLPLWPLIIASRSDGKIMLSNDGIGAALAVVPHSDGMLFGDDNAPPAFDLLPGDSVSLPSTGSSGVFDVQFEKLGRQCRVTLPIADDAPAGAVPASVRALPVAISVKRRAAQLKYRKDIDPNGIVVGASPAMLEVFEHIHHANAMEDGFQTVLLLGEPGVGKTHIAQLIHDSSSRASQTFKPVNAGGGGGDINIQRGEWIGHGKGHGIQGIDRNGHAGHLMNVDGGTLFVDEFATLSPDLQVIFLSVLEGRDIEKIGGESFTPNVRCIFATNACIDDAVAAGALRRDLVDRIAVTFHIPPLRERRGDVLLLAKHFAADHGITNQCLAALLRHQWPGNIRELRNTIAAAVARKNGDGASAIGLAHVDLPADIISAVGALDDDGCRRELWSLADEIAREEGATQGNGLQRRAGEIMGVGESQASKMYQRHGLAGAATA